jgi:hypothetical protein
MWLYIADGYVWKTRDGGGEWCLIMQESMFWSIKDRVSDIIQRAGWLLADVKGFASKDIQAKQIWDLRTLIWTWVKDSIQNKAGKETERRFKVSPGRLGTW